MSSVNDYLPLITSEHRDKPNFVAVLSTLLQGLVDGINTVAGMPPEFDVDLAVGVQLDAVGLWADITRIVTVVPSEAFPGASAYQVSLDDATFRRLIKARVAANRWNGAPDQLLQILNVFYQPRGITPAVFDNQDMSIDIYLAGGNPTDAEAAVLAQMIIPVRPGGVRINQSFISPTGPLFGLDVENSLVAGVDVGSFGKGF